MEKDFVTYEQALVLKELGYDKPCLGNYADDENHTLFTNGNKPGKTNAPLYSQAFRWFRDEYNLFCEIQIDKTTEPKFCFVILQYEYLGNYEKMIANEWYLYRTPELAESACLDELIEIVKNK